MWFALVRVSFPYAYSERSGLRNHCGPVAQEFRHIMVWPSPSGLLVYHGLYYPASGYVVLTRRH